MKNNVLFVSFFLILLNFNFPIYAQNYAPPFPRTVYQSPNGANGGAADYFYAQYDLAIHELKKDNARAFNDSIRAINPDILIFGTSKQGVWPGPHDPPGLFMYCATFLTLTDTAAVGDSAVSIKLDNYYSIPDNEEYQYALIGKDDWIEFTSIDSAGIYGIPTDDGFFAIDTTHAVGDSIRFPNRMNGFGMIHNTSSLAPQIEGKEAGHYFVDDRFTDQDYDLFDGVFYDAYRINFWAADFETENDSSAGIDLNLNRISDFEEFGSTQDGLDWINNKWEQGTISTLQYEHEQFSALHPPEKPSIITLNTGAAEDNYALDVCEGMLWEGFMRFATNWESMMQVNREWDRKMEERGMTNFTMIIDWERESRDDGRDRFNRMRYGLTTALLSGCFYGRTFGNYYYMTYYHDEFDTDLGYPTTEPQELSSGAWVRFFTKGAAICNPTGQKITVQSTELLAKSGYAGPYYRFRGGQDPDFNDGSLFESVDLHGEIRDPERDNQGDGILLFKDSLTVVADIWIGNTYNNDTSPGNSPVELIGEWVEREDWPNDEIHPWGDGYPCFSQWNEGPIGEAVYNDGIGYAYAYGGDGSETATFRPNIGVEGYYEIAEWHGGIRTGHTPYETQAELWVSDTLHSYLAINQFEKNGQWNKLAIAKLDSGTSNFLRINNNAPSYVLADAIRFRYLHDVVPDTLAPAMPANLTPTRQ